MTTNPTAQPVAWRVKDFADGWILFADREAAMAESGAMGGATVEAMYPALALLAAPYDAGLVDGLEKVLTKVREACLYGDDDGIGVTQDPHISSELFDEICSTLRARASQVEVGRETLIMRNPAPHAAAVHAPTGQSITVGPQPPAVGQGVEDGVREALKAAYEQGCIDTHRSIQAEPDPQTLYEEAMASWNEVRPGDQNEGKRRGYVAGYSNGYVAALSKPTPLPEEVKEAARLNSLEGPMAERCDLCRFWELSEYSKASPNNLPSGIHGYNTDGELSDCRRRAPAVEIVQEANLRGSARWPITKRFHWCGEFSRRVRPEGFDQDGRVRE